MIQKALKAFFESKEGEQVLGNIVFKAVRQAMVYPLKTEQTDEAARTRIVDEPQDVLMAICSYISRTEGALRGCQADAAAARNRAAQAREAVGTLIGQVNRLGNKISNNGVIDVTPEKKELTG